MLNLHLPHPQLEYHHPNHSLPLLYYLTEQAQMLRLMVHQRDHHR